MASFLTSRTSPCTSSCVRRLRGTSGPPRVIQPASLAVVRPSARLRIGPGGPSKQHEQDERKLKYKNDKINKKNPCSRNRGPWSRERAPSRVCSPTTLTSPIWPKPPTAATAMSLCVAGSRPLSRVVLSCRTVLRTRRQSDAMLIKTAVPPMPMLISCILSFFDRQITGRRALTG